MKSIGAIITGSIILFFGSFTAGFMFAGPGIQSVGQGLFLGVVIAVIALVSGYITASIAEHKNKGWAHGLAIFALILLMGGGTMPKTTEDFVALLSLAFVIVGGYLWDTRHKGEVVSQNSEEPN